MSDLSNRGTGDSIAERIAAIRSRVEEACKRAGRDPAEVRLVLVSKTVEAERVAEALEAGERILGESRVQEAGPKQAALAERDATWHMIGHLQTNKVRDALQWAQMIHSVDRLSLVKTLERELERRDGTVEVLVQVNTSGETSKFGVTPEEAEPLVRRIRESPRLRLRGLMTIAVHSDDEDAVRSCFVRLRELRDELETKGLGPLPELSMGMSGDFEIAVEEGATLIRVGTAIFGRRPGRDSAAGSREEADEAS